MIFEWDEGKNKHNQFKHGLAFAHVYEFDWENASITDRTRHGDEELRYAAVNKLNGKMHTVIFTKRGEYTRIISMRRSNKAEEKTYEATKNEKKPH